MFSHLQIHTFAHSCFSVDNTFFEKSLFDLIFWYKCSSPRLYSPPRGRKILGLLSEWTY